MTSTEAPSVFYRATIVFLETFQFRVPNFYPLRQSVRTTYVCTPVQTALASYLSDFCPECLYAAETEKNLFCRSPGTIFAKWRVSSILGCEHMVMMLQGCYANSDRFAPAQAECSLGSSQINVKKSSARPDGPSCSFFILVPCPCQIVHGITRQVFQNPAYILMGSMYLFAQHRGLHY